MRRIIAIAALALATLGVVGCSSTTTGQAIDDGYNAKVCGYLVEKGDDGYFTIPEIRDVINTIVAEQGIDTSQASKLMASAVLDQCDKYNYPVWRVFDAWNKAYGR